MFSDELNVEASHTGWPPTGLTNQIEKMKYEVSIWRALCADH